MSRWYHIYRWEEFSCLGFKLTSGYHYTGHWHIRGGWDRKDGWVKKTVYHTSIMSIPSPPGGGGAKPRTTRERPAPHRMRKNEGIVRKKAQERKRGGTSENRYWLLLQWILVISIYNDQFLTYFDIIMYLHVYWRLSAIVDSILINLNSNLNKRWQDNFPYPLIR